MNKADTGIDTGALINKIYSITKACIFVGEGTGSTIRVKGVEYNSYEDLAAAYGLRLEDFTWRDRK